MNSEKRFGVQEWGRSGPNCFYGCSNGCRYCYAFLNAYRFDRVYDYESWKHMIPNWRVINKGFSKAKERIMFPTSHDITNDIIGPLYFNNEFPEFHEYTVKNACFFVLFKLLKAGNDVLITTKPRLNIVKDICSMFKEFKEQIQFRFTITSYNDDLLRFWEPGAPPYFERLKSLKHAFQEGFKTSVSIEPFLDINPEFVVYTCYNWCTESIWLGKMNHIKANYADPIERMHYERLHEIYSDENLIRIYKNLQHFNKIRYKDRTRETLTKLVEG